MNPFTIAKDIKNIEKILKPALEKYIQGAGFAKSDEINEILRKISELEKRITKEVPNYDLKFKMIPGLSGWAQVNYPYGASINDTNIKITYDIFYLFNKSLMVDLLILFKTIRLVFNAKGAIPKNNSKDDID